MGGLGIPDDSYCIKSPKQSNPNNHSSSQAWRSSSYSHYPKAAAQNHRNHDGMSSIALEEREEIEVSIHLNDQDLLNEAA